MAITRVPRVVDLDRRESLRLAATVPVGRVACVRDDAPQVVPVNHAIRNDHVVFRSGLGSKLAAAWTDLEMVLEVDDLDAVTRTGWSVVLRGIGEPVLDPVEVRRLEALRLQPWAGEDREHWVRIRVYEVTGRRIVVEEV